MPKRDSDYQFISTDTQELETYMIAAYERITKTTVYPASPERLFIEWVASIILQERVLNNYTGNQNIPSRASGINLDELAELFYTQTRPEAKPAVCTMRFYISTAQSSSILVPAGTRVTDNSRNLVWETTQDDWVAIGDNYVDIPVRCQTAGIIGNGYQPGQIKTIVDLYPYYSECENITASDGGSDIPNDDEFYEILRASMDAYSTAGPSGAYAYHAKAVSTEIADVAAVRLAHADEDNLTLYTGSSGKYAFIGGDTIDPTSLVVYAHGSTTPAEESTDYTWSYLNNLLTINVPSGSPLYAETSLDVELETLDAGHVTIYVLMKDGTPAGTEIKNAVLEACSDATVRPLTDMVTVSDPDIVDYNIDITYYITRDSGKASSEIEAAVESAVNEFIAWQCEKLGRDINPSKLIDLLMDQGIKRVEVREPAFTHLNDGSANDVPQIATVGTVNIVSGGSEEE